MKVLVCLLEVNDWVVSQCYLSSTKWEKQYSPRWKLNNKCSLNSVCAKQENIHAGTFSFN